MSLATFRRFEAGANVSIEVLVRVAIALHAERELHDLFPMPEARTIDEVLKRRQLPRRGQSKR